MLLQEEQYLPNKARTLIYIHIHRIIIQNISCILSIKKLIFFKNNYNSDILKNPLLTTEIYSLDLIIYPY